MQKRLKKQKKKILYSKDLYPTDFRKKFIKPHKLFMNFFMNGGKAMKTAAFVRQAFSALYDLLLFENSIFLKSKYKFFETLGQIVLHDNTWFNFSNLLNYFVNKIRPIFYIQSISTAKTFKKKKKALRIKPYKLFLKQLPKHKRYNFAMRELSLYIKSVKRFYITDKIVVGLLDLFMHDKKAFLFKKKLKYYRKALSQYIIEEALQ
jgi:hypothetical protein